MQTFATVPTSEQYLAFLSLEQAKGWLKVQHTQDDILVKSLIIASIQFAEKYAGIDIIRKQRTTLFFYSDYTTGSALLERCLPTELPFGPYQSITSVQSKVGSQDAVTLTDTDYSVYGSSYLTLLLSGSGNPVYTVVYDSGLTIDPDVPTNALTDIKVALQQIITQWYVHREPIEVGTIVAKIPLSAQSILDKYKRNPVFI